MITHSADILILLQAILGLKVNTTSSCVHQVTKSLKSKKYPLLLPYSFLQVWWS